MKQEKNLLKATGLWLLQIIGFSILLYVGYVAMWLIADQTPQFILISWNVYYLFLAMSLFLCSVWNVLSKR